MDKFVKDEELNIVDVLLEHGANINVKKKTIYPVQVGIVNKDGWPLGDQDKDQYELYIRRLNNVCNIWEETPPPGDALYGYRYTAIHMGDIDLANFGIICKREIYIRYKGHLFYVGTISVKRDS